MAYLSVVQWNDLIIVSRYCRTVDPQTAEQCLNALWWEQDANKPPLIGSCKTKSADYSESFFA